MMHIQVSDQQYELSTKLGTLRQIESRFKVPMMQLFGKLSEALTEELVEITAIAAGKANDKAFKDMIYAEWDFADLFGTVQELVARLLFSGTPEQNEAKLAKFPAPEQQKNAIRVLLGMPIPIAPVDGTGVPC